MSRKDKVMNKALTAFATIVILAMASAAYAMWPKQVELNDATYYQGVKLLRTTVEEEKQFAKTDAWEDRFYAAPKEKRFCNASFGELFCYIRQDWGKTDRMIHMDFSVDVNDVADQFMECLELRRTAEGFQQVCTGTSFGDTEVKVITFTFKLMN